MVIDKDGNIDFQEWNVPSSWDELNLKTFQELERYYSDKEKDFDVREVLHIMCNKTKDEVNALPLEFAEKIVDKLAWLQEVPEYGEPTNELEIDGEKYIINIQSKLKTGEHVAAEMMRKQDPHNYAALLGILCRKQGEIYDSKFENEVLQGRIEMFERLPMMKVMSVVSFFFQLYVVLQAHSQLYTKAEEAINLIAKSIDNSHKIGVFKKQYMKWRIRTLRKSLKSIKFT